MDKKHSPAQGRAWQEQPQILRPGCLRGRTAIVTGAGTGIGRNIALRLVDLGAIVIGMGRRAAKLDETAALAGDMTGEFRGRSVDVRDESALTQAIRHASADGLDALVNNAGGQFYAPIDQISNNGFRSVIDLNLQSVYVAIKAAREGLAARGGAIINISLSGVDRGSVGIAHSISARAGVLALTRTLALEWAHLGIRANCLAPGLVITDDLPPEVAKSLVDDMVPRAVPVGRPTPTADVAEYVAFLVSAAGRMITGQLIQIDGAASLGAGLHMDPDWPH